MDKVSAIRLTHDRIIIRFIRDSAKGKVISAGLLSKAQEDRFFPVQIQEGGKGAGLRYELTLRLPEKGLPEGDWELWLFPSGIETDDKVEPLLLDSGFRGRLLLYCPSLKMRNGMLLFPMGGEGTRLVLRSRPVSAYDGMGVWWKERLSFCLCRLLKGLSVSPGWWVIYEKFCAQAQDNGYAFFCYCMDQLPSSERKKIFFILDRNAPAYEEVKRQYKGQIIPFMSFRHMCLMMLCRVYVASETRYHGYAWQSKPNPVFRDIRRGNHPILFLQHGVTAFKKDDGIFGRNGAEPVTWFTVTSLQEKQIVMEHFGYSKEEVPLLGFARWDRLYDWTNRQDPFILVMPTWRQWLEGTDESLFLQSQYYREYAGLLKDPRLEGILREKDFRLIFCLHPRFAARMKLFSSENSRITLLPYGSARLDQLAMACAFFVTDYSSLSWDLLYLEKPVIFYPFDLEYYLRKTGSYVDLNSELFGRQCRTRDQLLDVMTENMEQFLSLGQGGKKAPEDPVRSWFAFHDRDNSHRIYEFLKSQGC